MLINKAGSILASMILIFGAIGFCAPSSYLGKKPTIDKCEAVEKINWTQASPNIVFVNQATTVTITAQIEPDPGLVSSSVTLVECNERGKLMNNLGKLYDNVDQGNTLSGSGIFTKEIVVKKKEPMILYFRVSVPYKGILHNLLSDVFTVRVEAASEH